MTCADKIVTCVITSPDGQQFSGTNDCVTPQEVCPREPGENYQKCRDICNQPAHAEIIALARAGEAARGATVVVSGIGWVCRPCQLALYGAGVTSISVETTLP